MIDAGEYLRPLQIAFEENADPNMAADSKRYMRNLFDYYGLKAASRRKLQNDFLKEYGKPDISDLPELIEFLWDRQIRDWQYFAMDLSKKYLKKLREQDLSLIEMMITEKSWWDTVDLVASNHAGAYFQKFPEKIRPVTQRWINSGNMWLQRTSLIFQLKYKCKTDTDLLFDYISRLSGGKEFFINKAIGWALREYSKTDKDAVIEFVENNELSKLSRTEALKWLKNKSLI